MRESLGFTPGNTHTHTHTGVDGKAVKEDKTHSHKIKFQLLGALPVQQQLLQRQGLEDWWPPNHLRVLKND